MRLCRNWKPAAAFVVNLLTSDTWHENLYLRTGYFLLLYERTGCPKMASAAREFLLAVTEMNRAMRAGLRDLRRGTLEYPVLRSRRSAAGV